MENFFGLDFGHQAPKFSMPNAKPNKSKDLLATVLSRAQASHQGTVPHQYKSTVTSAVVKLSPILQSPCT